MCLLRSMYYMRFETFIKLYLLKFSVMNMQKICFKINSMATKNKLHLLIIQKAHIIIVIYTYKACDVSIFTKCINYLLCLA